MTFDYARSANTARRLLTKFGRTIQHVAVTEGVYDPATSTSTDTTVSTNVKGCDFDFDDKSGGQMYQDNSLMQVGDRYCLVAPDVAAINTSDTLIIDGVTWTIKGVKKLAPAGVLVMWECHIRK
jgi:hypothetical protein